MPEQSLAPYDSLSHVQQYNALSPEQQQEYQGWLSQHPYFKYFNNPAQQAFPAPIWDRSIGAKVAPQIVPPQPGPLNQPYNNPQQEQQSMLQYVRQKLGLTGLPF